MAQKHILCGCQEEHSHSPPQGGAGGPWAEADEPDFPLRVEVGASELSRKGLGDRVFMEGLTSRLHHQTQFPKNIKFYLEEVFPTMYMKAKATPN